MMEKNLYIGTNMFRQMTYGACRLLWDELKDFDFRCVDQRIDLGGRIEGRLQRKVELSPELMQNLHKDVSIVFHLMRLMTNYFLEVNGKKTLQGDYLSVCQQITQVVDGLMRTIPKEFWPELLVKSNARSSAILAERLRKLDI